MKKSELVLENEVKELASDLGVKIINTTSEFVPTPGIKLVNPTPIELADSIAKAVESKLNCVYVYRLAKVIEVDFINKRRVA